MNSLLLREIVSHVMSNFAIIPSDTVGLKTKSLLDEEYILPEKFRFKSDGVSYEGRVWGCQLSFLQNDVKVLLTECASDEFPEFAMAIKSKDAPTYGMYFRHIESDDPLDSDPMLAVSIDGKEWLNCTTFLQATFLAAMEQIRELMVPWQKCNEYKDLYSSLISFVKYRDQFIGQSDEG